MANTKISQLTATTTPTGSEELVYALNNANGKMTLNTMKTFATTGLQPELVSWTNIKTINWNDILWSWNIVISGGGGGWSTWTITLNAAENIAAWTLVSFDSTWVKKLRRWFYGTPDTWISTTVWTNQYIMIDSVTVNSTTSVVIYTDSSDDLYAVAIQYNWETRTVWTPIKVSSDWRFPKICCPYEWEFIIAYGYYGGSWAVNAIAWSVSGTTISLWTAQTILNTAPDQWWIAVVQRSDTDLREFVVFYCKDSDSKYYRNICTYNNALVITPWTEALYFWTTTSTWNIEAKYLWWWYAAILYDCVSWWKYYAYAWYSNVSWSSISSSNRLALYEWTYSTTLWFTPRIVKVKEDLYLADTWDSGTWLYLIRLNWGWRTQSIVHHTTPRVMSPTMWNCYCSEDLDKWIVWMFAIMYSGSSYEIVYKRFQWTTMWLEMISSVVYWTGNTNDVATVTRIWNISSCTYLDYPNSRLSNLAYQDESDIFLWINDAAATAWSPVDVTYSWVATTAWLTAWLPMYIWLDWAISQTWADGWKQIWIATGSTDALLK